MPGSRVNRLWRQHRHQYPRLFRDQSGENAAEETQQPEVDPAVAELLDDFDTSADGIVLGFSNSYNGNSYRQKEEALFYELADQLKAMGVLKDYIVTESNSDNATQASQIQSLILKGVDAIIVDPGSPTALNSAIEEAWDAGVPCVIVNGGPVTTDKCYQINFDYKGSIMPAAQYVADRLGGKGNVLISRGIAGVPSDTGFYEGMREVLDQYPDIKIVAEVYSEWNRLHRTEGDRLGSAQPGSDRCRLGEAVTVTAPLWHSKPQIGKCL